jgi:hypothetical protein
MGASSNINGIIWDLLFQLASAILKIGLHQLKVLRENFTPFASEYIFTDFFDPNISAILENYVFNNTVISLKVCKNTAISKGSFCSTNLAPISSVLSINVERKL